MIVVIDNYDSFTYNLIHYLKILKQEVCVFKNDHVTTVQITSLAPKLILISPGPCTPKESGVSRRVIEVFAGVVPIFGVCLGHQAIAQVYGGRIVHAKRIVHGKTSRIFHDGKAIFKNISSPFAATRYHSLVVDESTLPKGFEISARSDDGEIMAMRHRRLFLESVQFHPESILTKEGMKIMKNLIRLVG